MAVAATTFGIGFAPAHRGAGPGEHAEAVEEAGTEAEAEEASHAEEDEDPEGATAGAIASSILISLQVSRSSRSRSCPRGAVGCRSGLPTDRKRTVRPRSLGAASVVAALLSIGAAIIHFAVIAQQFDEWWLTGIFFLSIALFQLAGDFSYSSIHRRSSTSPARSRTRS